MPAEFTESKNSNERARCFLGYFIHLEFSAEGLLDNFRACHCHWCVAAPWRGELREFVNMQTWFLEWSSYFFGRMWLHAMQLYLKSSLAAVHCRSGRLTCVSLMQWRPWEPSCWWQMSDDWNWACHYLHDFSGFGSKLWWRSSTCEGSCTDILADVCTSGPEALVLKRPLTS